MNIHRKRKMIMLLFIVTILMLVTGLILYALRQNINLFYTPTQIIKGEAANRQTIRLGGMVVKGSVLRGEDGLTVQFQLTDYQNVITVNYRGILPDLFREGQGIVALGNLLNKNQFIAKEVLAKHDANYMPPEVREALRERKV